jgi:hypothetical protein
LRIETLHIPNGHRHAWNYLYPEKHCQAPMCRERYPSAIPEDMQSEAAAEIQAVREQIRRLRSQNRAAFSLDDDP